MIHPVYRRMLWREYLVWALLFTLISCFWVLNSGPAGLVYAGWIKAGGFLAIITYIYFFRLKYLYVFYNKGYSKRRLIYRVIIIDIVLAIPFWLLALLFNPRLTG